MAGFILIIDEKDRIQPVVETAVKGAEVKVLSVSDVAAAKRILLQETPDAMLSSLALGGDPTAGHTLCRELGEHPELSKVPVILISDTVSGELIEESTSSGAHGLIQWPVAVQMLRRRLESLIPDLSEVQETPEAEEPAAEPPPKAKTVPAAKEKRGETDEKLLMAQRLLAKVLHNLKTSDLLQVVELEDVPRVVSEMTRKVCGEGGKGSSAQSGQESSAGEKSTNDAETAVDLEQAFQIKES